MGYRRSEKRQAHIAIKLAAVVCVAVAFAGTWTSARAGIRTTSSYSAESRQRHTFVDISGPAADEGARGAPKFEIGVTLGKRRPVCQAYQKALAAESFRAPLQCGRVLTRPGPVKSPRFQSPDTTLIEAIYPSVMAILFGQQLRQRDVVAAVRGDPYQVAPRQAFEDQWAVPPIARIAPPVDVDNDGEPDQVLLWRMPATGDCATAAIWQQPLKFGPWGTYLFVLAGNKLDTAKSIRIIGHPKGDRVPMKGPDGKVTYFDLLGPRRLSGHSWGVFTYEGQTYVDTFYDAAADLANTRVSDPALADTLVVMQVRPTGSELICEIRVTPKNGRLRR